MRKIFSLVSVVSVTAALTLIALQYFPIPGVFLMMFGAAAIVGLLINVSLIALFVEAATGRVPKVLVAVPLLAYGAYYAAWWSEARQIEAVAARLRANNPGKIFDFDPRRHSLVLEEAQSFVETHDIPVAYDRKFARSPEGYSAYRLITRSQCSGIARDTQNRVLTFGVRANGSWQDLCLLRNPERPPQLLVTALPRGDLEIWKHLPGIREQTTDLALDGKPLGSFTTAAVWRLSLLPLPIIGCALNSGAPSWDCFAGFRRRLELIDGLPASVDKVRFDDPVSVMLGVPKYTDAELKDFQGFDANREALERVRGEAAQVQDQVFTTLQDIIDGKNPKLPNNLGYSLATQPDRLAPYAEAMTNRFAELVDADASAPRRQEQIRALSVAIGALPRSALQSIAEPLSETTRNDPKAYDAYPMIYIRLGETGTAMLPFYRDQFMSEKIRAWERMFPVLAICRIGQADPALIEEMKKRYLGVDVKGGLADPENFKSALFVTLLKSGEKAFLESNHPAPIGKDAWYEAVLSGKGQTDLGPNNCMPENWPSLTIYATPEARPRLDWRRGGWEEISSRP